MTDSEPVTQAESATIIRDTGETTGAQAKDKTSNTKTGEGLSKARKDKENQAKDAKTREKDIYASSLPSLLSLFLNTRKGRTDKRRQKGHTPGKDKKRGSASSITT